MFKQMRGQKEHEAEEMQWEGVGGGRGLSAELNQTKVDFNNTSVRASLSSPENAHFHDGEARRDGTRRGALLKGPLAGWRGFSGKQGEEEGEAACRTAAMVRSSKGMWDSVKTTRRSIRVEHHSEEEGSG